MSKRLRVFPTLFFLDARVTLIPIASNGNTMFRDYRIAGKRTVRGKGRSQTNEISTQSSKTRKGAPRRVADSTRIKLLGDYKLPPANKFDHAF